MTGVHGYLTSVADTIDEQEYQAYVWNFGSPMASIITLYFASMSGSWEDGYALLGKCGRSYKLVYLFWMSFYSISVSNVLTGMFVDEVIKASAPDREQLALEARRDSLEAIEELKGFLKSSDKNSDGTICYKEFEALMEDSFFVSYLESFGIEVKDCGILFKMLTAISGSDEIGIDDFVEGCFLVKGEASALDLQTLRAEIHHFFHVQRMEMQRFHGKIDLIYRHTDEMPRSHMVARPD
eukprot:gnl/TRDRNA2_/TRDRNA2_176894_c4_seq45.p1 gnl/TRDRNA2_/TRDRNA2_176894_c4~~gnl/TRDRNA2_/TRDRNA2_176894_c4_seq45.p1  ORF type:complete len:247 (-),score=39.28 gnl/TRDRNA2_/TRDRNA2_176894_c4_seq45:329-1045(-)